MSAPLAIGHGLEFLGAGKSRCAAAAATAVSPSLALMRIVPVSSLTPHSTSASLSKLGSILSALVQSSPAHGGPIGILESLAQGLHARLSKLLAFGLANFQALQEALAQETDFFVAGGLWSGCGRRNRRRFDGFLSLDNGPGSEPYEHGG